MLLRPLFHRHLRHRPRRPFSTERVLVYLIPPFLTLFVATVLTLILMLPVISAVTLVVAPI